MACRQRRSFYNPAGRWVTSYRILRFFPDGTMFTYLCSSQTPIDLLRAASQVASCSPQTLTQRLKGACWGSYELHESDGHVDGDGGGARPQQMHAISAAASTHITAQVLLVHEA